MPQKKDRPLPSPCTTLIAHRDGKDTIRLYSVPAHSLHRLSETRPFEGRFPTGFFSRIRWARRSCNDPGGVWNATFNIYSHWHRRYAYLVRIVLPPLCILFDLLYAIHLLCIHSLKNSNFATDENASTRRGFWAENSNHWNCGSHIIKQGGGEIIPRYERIPSREEMIQGMDEYIQYLKSLPPEKGYKVALEALIRTGVLNPDGRFKKNIVSWASDTE